ncbi:MAG TPA: glycerol-3-phosphate acyltransferase [Longimicrobiaceae bacterium]|nr:glycerol-3-phosphate acyltransferase [Longimicrobiaceae bacterium]
MSPPSLTLAAVLAYALGCVSTGYYLVRLRTGKDVREEGSGSVGARNVGRVLGRKGFALVFLGDCAKGAAAVWAANALGTGQPGVMLAMLAVVLGHVFPVQLRFRGGKGASTALGALLAIDFRVALAALLVCAALYAASRRAVPSGLVVFSFLPVLAGLFGHSPAGVTAVAAVSVLLLLAHRENVAEAVRELRGVAPTPNRAPR